ncbi:MAG: hypothetical protein Q9219_005485 [cf. Caloplaca sp. 3 TL-2023]
MTPSPLCLHLETSTGSFPPTTLCPGSSSLPGISVPAHGTQTFHPSPGWNGALTPLVTQNQKNNIPGTRLEINFAPDGRTWYDADMELGMSGATLGPINHKRRLGAPTSSSSSSSLAGEPDPLAKANEAWLRSAKRSELLKYPKYIAADKDGKKLLSVYCDKDAPAVVREFFQLEAGFLAYLGPGSVEGMNGGGEGEGARRMREKQDGLSWVVEGWGMEVVVF